ncbi:hypothetical protein [Streptomyces sp. NPDC005012]|uniref:hypothetical protein n=1 Tax=unclassified Streptomyces TaxID=2593676 RepID=UPI0033AA272F
MHGENLEGLFAEVCRTLASAGFDVASVSAEERAGLRVREERGAVVVGWVPAAELDPAGRPDAEYEGIRAALRQALLEILVGAGHNVEVDLVHGEVRVMPS